MMKFFVNILVAVFLLANNLSAQVRANIDFDKDWKFFLGNDSLASSPGYDDRSWRKLSLPHDWSIEASFSKSHPATNQGGALPGGIGWYRKSFTLPAQYNNKKIAIEFDGVYKNSEVWINGHYLGMRPNGYISFVYDVDPYLKSYPAKNIIAVKVDNSQQPDSRWYSGSGIYRHVRLVVRNNISIAPWGIFITTPEIREKSARVLIQTQLENFNTGTAIISLRTEIFDGKGKLVATGKSPGIIKLGTGSAAHALSLSIPSPQLWSVSNSYLYKAVTSLYSQGKLLDRQETIFGIRYFHFDPAKGFTLNGKPLKINGVCMHHDLGALGAAVNTSAMKRQLKLLKEMGCNAIRTAHNPPAPEFLDLCDQMGFLVMDEAFDMWQKRKNKFDYHLYFKEWHKKDLAAMLLRDRNHPSVFMWSIGNEIREQFDSSGIRIARELGELVKSLDNTRPVTCALTENDPSKNYIYQSGVLDVLGFNYKLNDYKELPARFPGQKFIATETASALATRDYYDWPSDSARLWPPDAKQPFEKGNPDMTVSAYDQVYAYWGSSHEAALKAVNSFDFMAGSFVWSGFDFLGEPVPYPWPARSSYYGIIDLAGFPKDVYWLYQSTWTDKPVLHIFPHWNWQLGQDVDVWAYYNQADEVELFLNGKSLGIRKKENGSLHVMWKLKFEPGLLKAISRKNGKVVLVKQLETAGAPAKIELKADRGSLIASDNELAFVTVKILDRKGRPVPDASNLIQFSMEGAGALCATDNGFQADTSSFQSRQRHCWKGKALAIIKATQKKGNITLKASSPGLAPAVISFKVVEK